MLKKLKINVYNLTPWNIDGDIGMTFIFFISSLFDKIILFGKILMIKYKRAKYVLQNN